MAKATTAKAPKKVKKAAKAVSLKARPDGSKKKGGKKKSKASNAADALWKLAEHPLVGDLLAAGAMAAVAAIAEKGLIEKGKKGVSSRVVKDAGKAAAAAIGLRLLTEFDEAKKVTKPAKAAKTAKA
jgi:hypothetical protein